eukprot:393384-Rhodomonas_salina.3
MWRASTCLSLWQCSTRVSTLMCCPGVYSLQEFVQDCRIMELFHVSTNEQAAQDDDDLFTKSLPSQALQKHHTVLSGD